MRIFKNKPFQRYARKQKISDTALCAAVKEIEDGLVDADLGGNLYKKRIAKSGMGKRGGHRTLLAYVKGDRAFFMFGFEKNDMANVSKDDQTYLKALANTYIDYTDSELAHYINGGAIFEVNCDDNI